MCSCDVIVMSQWRVWWRVVWQGDGYDSIRNQEDQRLLHGAGGVSAVAGGWGTTGFKSTTKTSTRTYTDSDGTVITEVSEDEYTNIHGLWWNCCYWGEWRRACEHTRSLMELLLLRWVPIAGYHRKTIVPSTCNREWYASEIVYCISGRSTSTTLVYRENDISAADQGRIKAFLRRSERFMYGHATQGH